MLQSQAHNKSGTIELCHTSCVRLSAPERGCILVADAWRTDHRLSRMAARFKTTLRKVGLDRRFIAFGMRLY